MEAVVGPGQVAFCEFVPRKWWGGCVRGESRGTDGGMGRLVAVQVSDGPDLRLGSSHAAESRLAEEMERQAPGKK